MHQFLLKCGQTWPLVEAVNEIQVNDFQHFSEYALLSANKPQYCNGNMCQYFE